MLGTHDRLFGGWGGVQYLTFSQEIPPQTSFCWIPSCFVAAPHPPTPRPRWCYPGDGTVVCPVVQQQLPLSPLFGVIFLFFSILFRAEKLCGSCPRWQDVWRRHLHENSQKIINFLSVTEARSSSPLLRETCEVEPFRGLLLLVEFHIIVGLLEQFRSREFDWRSRLFPHHFSVIAA